MLQPVGENPSIYSYSLSVFWMSSTCTENICQWETGEETRRSSVLCGAERSCRLKPLFRPLECLPPVQGQLSQLTFNLFSLQRRSTGPRCNILSFKIFKKEAIVYYIIQTLKRPPKNPGSVLTVLAQLHILDDLNLT